MAVLEGQQQGDPQQEHPRAGPGRQGGPEGGQGRAQLLQVRRTAVLGEFRELIPVLGEFTVLTLVLGEFRAQQSCLRSPCVPRVCSGRKAPVSCTEHLQRGRVRFLRSES